MVVDLSWVTRSALRRVSALVFVSVPTRTGRKSRPALADVRMSPDHGPNCFGYRYGPEGYANRDLCRG